VIHRFLIALLAAAALIVVTSGCNTVRGAGEDIESVGKAMSGGQ
jgi:predicted small secreted protein